MCAGRGLAKAWRLLASAGMSKTITIAGLPQQMGGAVVQGLHAGAGRGGTPATVLFPTAGGSPSERKSLLMEPPSVSGDDG